MSQQMAVVINKKDNVATAVKNLKMGELIEIEIDKTKINLRVKEDIPVFHKFALKDLECGEKVYKYGEIIGEAVKKIEAGQHVHIHNIKSLRG